MIGFQVDSDMLAAMGLMSANREILHGHPYHAMQSVFCLGIFPGGAECLDQDDTMRGVMKVPNALAHIPTWPIWHAWFPDRFCLS